VDPDEEFLGFRAFTRHVCADSVQEKRKSPQDFKQPLTHYLIKSIAAGSDFYHPRALRKVRALSLSDELACTQISALSFLSLSDSL
jgi:hypothetical protein